MTVLRHVCDSSHLIEEKITNWSPDFRSSSAPCNTWTRIDPRAKVWNWIKETELKQRARADTCCRTESMSFWRRMRLEWFFWQTRSDASSMNTHLELQAQQKIRRAPGTLAGGTLKVKTQIIQCIYSTIHMSWRIIHVKHGWQTYSLFQGQFANIPIKTRFLNVHWMFKMCCFLNAETFLLVTLLKIKLLHDAI